jgi:hypothetical protein
MQRHMESGIDSCSGAIAQLGEHLLCKQGVVGSIPTGSTIELYVGANLFAKSVAAKAAPTSN